MLYKDKNVVAEIVDIRDALIKIQYEIKNRYEPAEKHSVIVYEEHIEPYTEPRWTFTDDEKVILRNLEQKYNYIARDKDGEMYAYTEKPIKVQTRWANRCDLVSLVCINHLFQSIKWEDEEPCEFRKYL